MDGSRIRRSTSSRWTTLNLHTLQPQLIKDCKDGGWQNFSDPPFKNQSQCVSFVQHQGD